MNAYGVAVQTFKTRKRLPFLGISDLSNEKTLVMLDASSLCKSILISARTAPFTHIDGIPKKPHK